MVDENEEDRMTLPNTVKIYGGILLVLIFICGSIGNTLNILCVTLYSKLRRKVVNILLLCISIYGLVIDIVCVPTLGLHVINYWPVWPLNKTLCTVVSFLTNTCTSMMVATLMLFSIDRYLIVVRKRMIGRKKIVISVMSLTLVICASHGSYMFQINHENFNKTNNISVCNQLDGELLAETVQAPIFAITIIHAIVTFVAIVLLSVSSFTWWKIKNKDLDSPLRSIENDLKGSSVITVGCLLFWLPNWILLLFRSYKTTTVRMVVISFILSLISTTVAPFSSLMFLKTIRRTCINILTGCKGSDLFSKTSDRIDGDKNLLTHNTILQRTHYEDIGAPQTFVKGNFKRGTTRITMDSVSIDSNEFSTGGDDSHGHDNTSYDDITELHPQRESVF